MLREVHFLPDFLQQLLLLVVTFCFGDELVYELLNCVSQGCKLGSVGFDSLRKAGGYVRGLSYLLLYPLKGSVDHGSNRGGSL